MERFNLYILNFAHQNGIVNAATGSAEVQVGNEYDFEVTELRAIINGATDVTGPLLINLKLSGGQFINENPLDLFSIAGISGAIGDNSMQPIRVPWVGAVIPAATKVTLDWTNSSGQTLDFGVQFIGRKIFK